MGDALAGCVQKDLCQTSPFPRSKECQWQALLFAVVCRRKFGGSDLQRHFPCHVSPALFGFGTRFLPESESKMLLTGPGPSIIQGLSLPLRTV